MALSAFISAPARRFADGFDRKVPDLMLGNLIELVFGQSGKACDGHSLVFLRLDLQSQ